MNKIKPTGEQLKQMLTDAGISVKQLATKIGIPYSTLSSQLNEFTPLTTRVIRAAESMIKERSK